MVLGFIVLRYEFLRAIELGYRYNFIDGVQKFLGFFVIKVNLEMK